MIPCIETFGEAVVAMKQGFKVSRKQWREDVFVYYVPENSYPARTEVAKKEFGDMVKYNAYFAIRNVDGKVSPYTPSTDSILAEDWYVVQ